MNDETPSFIDEFVLSWKFIATNVVGFPLVTAYSGVLDKEFFAETIFDPSTFWIMLTLGALIASLFVQFYIKLVDMHIEDKYGGDEDGDA